MQALPSAFFHQVSSASRMRVPRAWMAKSTMRGGAAEGRGARAGFEIVGAGGAAEGHVEMGVAIDAAGEDVHAGGVDDFGRRSFRDAGADFLDDFAFDQDVGGECVRGGDDGAVADEGVQVEALRESIWLQRRAQRHRDKRRDQYR